MKLKFLSYLSVSILISLVACKEKDWRDDPKYQNPELQAKVESAKQEILSNRKKSYSIENGYSSKEEAIQEFLVEVKNSKEFGSFASYVSWEQQVKVIFPNTYGYGTALDFSPLEDYRKLLSEREQVGYQTIKSAIKEPYKIKKIEWEKPRQYNQLIAHKPKVIISSNSKENDLSQIKMVYEIGGKFIVGVLGP